METKGGEPAGSFHTETDQLISTQEIEQEIMEMVTRGGDQEVELVIATVSPLVGGQSQAEGAERQHLAEGAFLLACSLLGLIIMIVFYKQIYQGLSGIWDSVTDAPVLGKWRRSRRESERHITLYSPCWQTLSPGNGQDHLIDITRLEPLIRGEEEIMKTGGQ